jgi:hypothetical protein
MTTFKRLLLLVPFLLLLVPSSASAEELSPWWHLSTTSRPSYINPSAAKDEVLRLTVSATSGHYHLEHENLKHEKKTHLLSFEASAEQVQQAFEKLYEAEAGPGNIEVTGGPGNGTGSDPYEIKFIGKLGDRVVEPAVLQEVEVKGGPATVEVSEAVKGRAAGLVTVTAMNLGDAPVLEATCAKVAAGAGKYQDSNCRKSVSAGEGEFELVSANTPVTMSDLLPPGLEAAEIEGTVFEKATTHHTGNALDCSLASLSCAYTSAEGARSLPPYEQMQMQIAVNVVGEPAAISGKLSEASRDRHGAAHDLRSAIAVWCDRV